MTGPMRGRRAPRRSCVIHGDNGCEIQGEAGLMERQHEKRQWLWDVDEETAPDQPESR